MESFNSLFNNVSKNGRFILKKYPDWADIPSIQNGQKIAQLFKKHSIPAVPALRSGFEKDHYFQGFPYIEGCVLSKQEIKIEQVKIIARLLQKMHEIKLDMAFAPDLEPYSISMQDWQNWSQSLDIDLGQLKEINESCLKACSIKPSDIVISHRDLTLNNVIWQNSKPYIIDWDLSGKISQAQDVLATALNWSLKEDATIDQDLFQAFLEAYDLPLIEAEWSLAKYRVLANWLNWVALNIKHFKPQNQARYSLQASLHLYQQTRFPSTVALK